MVHDQTNAEMWYHDVMNEVVMFKVWADLIQFYRKHRKENPEEYDEKIDIVLAGFEKQYNKVKAMMLEEFYEKERLAKAGVK